MERVDNFYIHGVLQLFYVQRLYKCGECVLIVEYNPRTRETCFYSIGSGKRGKYKVYGTVLV